MDERFQRVHSLVTAALLIFVSSIPVPGEAENFTISYLATFRPVRDQITRQVTRGMQGRVISGAVSHAVQQINADPNLLDGHFLSFVHDDSCSDALVGMEIMSRHWKDGCAAFFGPEDSCEFEGKLASAWNLPMFAYKCASRQVSDKTQYPTFIRTSPLAHQVTKSVLSLLIHFRWRHFTIVTGSTEAWQSISTQLEDMALRFGLTLNHPRQLFKEPYSAGSDRSDPVEIQDIVENTYIDTRVYVFLGARNALVDLLLAMDKKQLFAHGLYAVIYIDLDNNNASANLDKYFQHDYDHPEQMATIEMARSLLVIVPSPLGNPDNYQRFVDNVNTYNGKRPFGFIYKTMSIYAAYLYDAIFLYARALDKVIQSGGNPYDGKAIVDNIRGRSFSSIQGFITNIDENGDAEGNYTVLSRQLLLSRSQHPFAMLPVAFFKLQANQSEQLPTFVLFENQNINWTSGEPPADKPVCGYRGENCISPPNLTKEISAGVFGGLVLVGAILGLIVYRNWRYEQEIAGLLWKVNIEDVQGFDKALNGSKGTLLSQGSVDSHMSYGNQIFTLTGKFRGQVVAMKRYTKRTTEITRSLKKEMKLMRELHHDNVNAFVGACVDPPSIILLTEYCSKGSLQDILENDDINLDSMFVASFVMDLIKGMLFLHDSELHIHGNLKSSNCVVTSCWTLQVADYGLLSLRQSALDQDPTDNYVHCKNKLWTAPELLRDKGHAVRGTQKADIYAFGIILHEIIAREGPFGDVGLSVIEIIEGVRAPVPGFPYVRPNISQIGCQDFIISCMQDCWSESPYIRPDFRSIRTRLKPMMHGMKPNIFDNMIAIMEKYQTQLEELVADRTGQLVDEKRKTEALLLRMLPKSVVDQLVRGKAVIPEAFTSVTIYFSDICGFTALSAESFPMQVVDLLNDLYTMFDSIISHYDVYKVETIGDAYMVVSGLPLRNGDNHAGQIASMALSLLSAIKSFQIRHRPNETLKLRVGIHSGPCVAGVVGLTMPRYCLFGDTVNTASRMESNGEPLKIHVSGECKRILDKLGGYETEPRGNICMKGKGEMFTYWLLSDDRSRFKKLFRAKSTESDSMMIQPTPRGGGRDGAARRPSRRPDDHNNRDLVEQANNSNNNDFLGLLRENEAFTEARRRSDGDRRRVMMRLGLQQRRVFDANSPTRSSCERLPHPTDHSGDGGAIFAHRACADSNRKCKSFRSPRANGWRDEIPVALTVANGGLSCATTKRHLAVDMGTDDGGGEFEDEENEEGEKWVPAESDRLLEETMATEDIQFRDISSTLCV